MSSHKSIPFIAGVCRRPETYQQWFEEVSSPLRSHSPLSIFLHNFPPKIQQTMQSGSDDWDETFRYLTREILAPEFMTTDLQQVPTPPVRPAALDFGYGANLTLASPPLQASDTFSPRPIESTTIVSVSTTFFPGADLGQSHPPDLTLHSSDSVFFYVHSTALLHFSTNSFNSLVPLYPLSPASEDGSHPAIVLPEDSHVLNIVLHLLYTIPCSHFCPPIDVISKAVRALKRYGVPMKSFTTPDTCLYNLIMSRAPLHPIELYAIAAEHDLYDLAVAISPHLMSFNLATLTDEIVMQIGPMYLKRLFFLHLGRNEALKRLLFNPPTLHGPTPQCDFTEQKKLTRAWALAAAYLAWDARPGLSRHVLSSNRMSIYSSCYRLSDLSTSAISSALGSLQDHLSCQLCRDNLRQRVKQIIVEWSNVKVSSL